jgi:Family of unknown function (DUF6364)
MDAKLTLSLDKKIIEQAKKYARRKNTSLSQLIENYLAKVTAYAKEDIVVSPRVKNLSGIIKANNVSVHHPVIRAHAFFIYLPFARRTVATFLSSSS